MAQQQRQRLLALRNDLNLAPYVQEGTATGKLLGTGSYGSVLEIKVNGLNCAAKKMHEALIDANNDGAENIAVKYVQECQIMANLRHPNVALFLGVCFLENCLLPVLLMEKLDDCLDNLLETVSNIPLALKRSMLEDVARGLLYLHSHNPQIIHRDLTAKNVLLTSHFAAKLTDFGNSRIVNLYPDQLARTLSRLPGTLVYMPPEAMETSSCYGPSLDVFSFGHLALFVGLQIFPGNLLQHTYPDPTDPEQLLARSEVGRRERYFEQLEDLLSGPVRQVLVPLIKECLQNAPSQRPTAEQLVTALEEMKADIEGDYGALATVDAVRQVKTMKALKAKSNDRVNELAAKEEEIQQLQHQLEVAEERHEVELRQREEQSNVELRQKDNQLVQQTRAVHQLNAQLREMDAILCQFRQKLQQKETQLREKEVELQQRNAYIGRLQRQLQAMQESLDRARLQFLYGPRPPIIKTSTSELKLPLKLNWRRGKDMPYGLDYYPQVVVFKGKVYIGGGKTSFDQECQTVMVYDLQHDCYDTLPPYYTYMWFSMGVVNNQLVLIGGRDFQTNEVTNQLGVWNEISKRWTHPLPPMATACSSPSVATYNNRWLVVIGGYSDGNSLSQVEILDTSESGQWYQAAPMPQPCYNISTAIIGSTCYIMGGYSTIGNASNKVFSVHMDELISQAVAQPAGASAPPTLSPYAWVKLPNTPLCCSTALVINEALLAIGGLGGSTSIYHYEHCSRNWISAGELPARRSACGCIVLPSGEVLVAGGDRNEQRVDIAVIE